MSRSRWMLALCVGAMLGVFGCSSDDVNDVLGVDPEGATAEAALEGALNNVVEPLATVLELAMDLTGGRAAAGVATVGGPTCPPTTGVCSSGTVTCTVGEAGLEFEFTTCTVTADSSTVTINGLLRVAETSTLLFTLANLQIDGSTGLNGTMSLTGCTSVWDIDADDGTLVSGTVIACSEQNPQEGSSLVIRFQDDELGLWVMTITFNGTTTAIAAVTVEGAPYADCTVNLDTFDASCTGA